MKLLAIIVTYNAMPWIDRCLHSVACGTVAADVVVIDNSSTDGTVARIRDCHPEVTVVETGRNLGFGAANNIGLRKLVAEGYDYAYLLNQDAWLEADTLEKLICAAKDGFGILSPVQVNADGSVDAFFRKHCGKVLNVHGTAEVRFVMAAHWLMTREAVLRVGGFSPAFPHYGEDENYIDRLHLKGLKCGVVTDARAVHDRGGRKSSVESRMNMKCRSEIVKISNPGACPLWRLLATPVELLGMAVKNFSLIPLRFIPEFFRRSSSLLALRKESFRDSAFL